MSRKTSLSSCGPAGRFGNQTSVNWIGALVHHMDAVLDTFEENDDDFKPSIVVKAVSKWTHQALGEDTYQTEEHARGLSQGRVSRARLLSGTDGAGAVDVLLNVYRSAFSEMAGSESMEERASVVDRAFRHSQILGRLKTSLTLDVGRRTQTEFEGLPLDGQSVQHQKVRTAYSFFKQWSGYSQRSAGSVARGTTPDREIYSLAEKLLDCQQQLAESKKQNEILEATLKVTHIPPTRHLISNFSENLPTPNDLSLPS